MSDLPQVFVCRGMYQCKLRRYVKTGKRWERYERFDDDWELDDDVSEETARYAWDNAVELYLPVERKDKS